MSNRHWQAIAGSLLITSSLLAFGQEDTIKNQILLTNNLEASSGYESLAIGFFLIVLTLLGIGLWSAVAHIPAFHPAAKIAPVGNMFLPLDFVVHGSSESGFLRALAPKEAQIVVTRPLEKGSDLDLKLGGLPNFPKSGDQLVSAVVAKTSKLPGQPTTYLLSVRFKESKLLDVPLTAYLHSLRSDTKVSAHAGATT